MISVNPYLVYRGNCEEAFNYYKTVFGGESLYIGRYKDVPEEARKFFSKRTRRKCDACYAAN